MSNAVKLLLLFWAFVVLFVLNLLLGSVSISVDSIFRLFTGTAEEDQGVTLIWMFRMPKALTAIIAGASLGVSGLLMQTFFRNPIAGPFVLGISSGASLGVAILILATEWLAAFAFFDGWLQSSWALVFMATFGAGIVLFLLLLVSLRIRDVNTLLILGLMFGSATSAVVALLQYFSSQQALQNFVLWTMGSLTAVTNEELYCLLPLCSLALIGSFLMSKTLDGLLLGEQYAMSMGIHVRRAQQMMMILAAVLAGSITAFCGPIAFIGIAVPHLARMMFRTHQHKLLIIGTILLGMITLLFCQLVAQLPGSDKILPINVVTSFLGAPMVIYIVLSRRTIVR